jgi:hypothetical protein
MATFRDHLIRAVFELDRDLTWWKTLEPNYRDLGLDAATMTSRREAFNQSEEKRTWPGWQSEAKRFSNAVLDDMRMDRIEMLDAIGMLHWQRERTFGDREKLARVFKGTAAKEGKSQEQSKDRGREM